MFIVFLRFAENKPKAPQFMEAHKAWIKQGLADGVFLVVGSLQPNAGGAIVANNVSREEIEQRVQLDPFVAEKIVMAEIHEITPGQADDRLDFLLSA
ncbi:YciI family protein [Terasakiella sp. A23]|uniref:YciI family protein n=1 Tax=Terasakiella sp. FCG-A23 TaxID=3080561 RepID=UPI0029546F9B|nr:YciI family protein [Terasakiella sp. A23]MDV7339692.1 YciI family protein [Terasakiella sp. A23]